MRIVIKIGTSTLAHPTGHLNIRLVEQLTKVFSEDNVNISDMLNRSRGEYAYTMLDLDSPTTE